MRISIKVESASAWMMMKDNWNVAIDKATGKTRIGVFVPDHEGEVQQATLQ